MNEIIDYKTIQSTDWAYVNKQTSDAVRRGGWQPLGHMQVAQSANRYTVTTYVQTLVKYAEETDIKSVRYVEGKPADVENEINCFLDQGWKLRGEQFTREENGVIVIVQCMTFTG